MRKVLPILLFVLALIGRPINGVQKEKQANARIGGRVVALNTIGWMYCMYGCSCSFVMRVSEPGELNAEYVRVSFACDTGVISESTVPKDYLKLDLIRSTATDKALEEFILWKSRDKIEKVPVWQMVTKSRTGKLPFGQTLPSYWAWRDVFSADKHNE